MASHPQSENTQPYGDNKKDPGWKHCYLKNPNDTNSVTCRFCGFTPNGGIFRAKQHIAGNSKNVRKCKECPQSVRDELLNYMNEKKKQTLRACGGMKQDFCFLDIDEDEDDEEDVQPSKKRSLTSIHETGTGSGSGSGSGSVKGPMDLFITKKKTKGGKLRQTNINDACDKELRDRTVQKIARFMYQAAISFNAAHLDSFKEMIEAIGQYGPNLKLPSYHELRVPLLQKEIAYTNELLKENRDECEKYGCSIMSDGWTDRKHRTLINFLVNSPKGTMILESVDASAHVKTGTLLFELLDRFVERVGEKNVVQVITDNGSNYVLAGKLLQAKIPNLFWTPCAAHCIDLMLEDIGKIEVVRKTISRAIAIVGYIYNHGGVLHMMREFTGNKELARHGVTRFVTTFLTLQSLHKRQKALKRMFISTQWIESKWSNDIKGKKANDTVFKPSFWNNVTYTLKVMCPLMMVLRIADNETRPAMGYIYEAMDRAKETILKSFDNNREKCKKVLEFIDARWDNQNLLMLDGIISFIILCMRQDTT
ncbi:uncharacterized protein LOC142547406 [Primulina tabacum]|uniref:uncharacterized protein LOC142547406 n=1 Tax=Primulina tabacum TaxID=48773 RepID=UPI003F5A9E1A